MLSFKFLFISGRFPEGVSLNFQFLNPHPYLARTPVVSQHITGHHASQQQHQCCWKKLSNVNTNVDCFELALGTLVSE